MRPTLLLNQSFEPLGKLNIKKVVKLVLLKKVEIIEEYQNEEIKSINFSMKMPAVVRLLKHIHRKPGKIRFSKRAIFIRDQAKCQYCGKKQTFDEATYDHVTAKSKGGRASFTNMVTACRSCNTKKGNRSPEEAGMKLLKQPTQPDIHRFMLNHFVLGAMIEVPTEWLTYLEPYIRVGL